VTAPVTTGLKLVPMLLLYELSILVAAAFERGHPPGAEDEPAERPHL
jgi:Sec-independent protein secretion pathway component TatC